MNYRTELKNINRMACPILLNYLLMSVFEILDKAIVGHYSIQGFAVIGIAAAPIYEVTGALGVLSAAFNILAAKQKGEGDHAAFEAAFRASRVLAMGIGGAFFLLSLAGGRLFFRRIYSLEGAALEELLGYFYPAAFTVVQNMLLFQYAAYYRNRLNTRISFYSTLVSTLVNLFFDAAMVHGLWGLPRLGTAGAAWGSVIGLGAGLLVYQIPYFLRRPSTNCGQNRHTVKMLLRLYPPLLGQEFLESTLFVVVVSGAVARLGTEQMAVYSLLETVRSTLSLPIYAYATASQTFAYQHRAAGHPDQAGRYLRRGQQAALAIVSSLWLLCFLWQGRVLGWVVSAPTVTAAAGQLLPWVFAAVLARVSYQFCMGYLQGTGGEQFVFFCAAVSTLLSSLGVMLGCRSFGLPGVYSVMAAEALILTAVFKLRLHREPHPGT